MNGMRWRLPHGRNFRLMWRNAQPAVSTALLAVLIIVPLGLLGWFTFYTDVFTIQAVTVVDAREETTEEIRRIVQMELNNNTATQTSNSLFFVRPEVIEGRVLTELPYIRSVHVQRQLPGTLKVIVQEKNPALLLLVTSQYYFVDDQGIAYEKARLETLPGLIIPTVKNRGPGSEVILGTRVLSEAFVNFVQTMEEKLPEAADAEVVEVVIPALAAREVQFQLNNNWKIRFDVTRSTESQLTLLRDLITTTISAEERARLDYIDLRIPKRIYYKTRFNLPSGGTDVPSGE